MSSIKCSQCNLVNFSTESHCKRCGKPPNDYAPIIEQRQYQGDFNQYHQPQNYSNHFSQPAFAGQFEPSWNYYCVKCGSSQNLSVRTFDKKYVSPTALLGIFMGLLPYFILRKLFTTTHKITSPFCEVCWGKFKNIETHSALFNFGAAMLIILGFLVGGMYDSFLVFGVSVCLAIPLFIYGRIYVAKISPKFKKVTDKQVIINAPIVGEIVFTK